MRIASKDRDAAEVCGVERIGEQANRLTDDHRYIPKTMGFIETLFYKDICHLIL